MRSWMGGLDGTSPRWPAAEARDAVGEMLSPAAVVPAQLFPVPGVARLAAGEAALLAAVLEDALVCFAKQFASRSPRALRAAREAERWLFRDEPRWPFSFVSICDVLGIDAAGVRGVLARMRRTRRPYATG